MKVMLDSGAYSAWRKKTTIDIDQYIDFVKRHSDVFEVCVNLDVIGDGRKSYENWIYLRKAGVNAMPVFHIGTDEGWLHKYMRKCDYVGIGAIANLSASRRFHGLNHVWKEFLSGSNVKVHGMGLTDTQWLVRYPWHSVDSVSPVLQAAYGGIYVPRIEDGAFNFLKLDMYKVSNKSKGHESGTISSYFALPHSIKAMYGSYFQSKGFVLGKLGDIKSTPMFAGASEDEDDGSTFTGSYLPRVLWNLDMWVKLMERVRQIHKNEMTVYVGTTSHFKAILERGLGSLLSYFIVNSDKQLDNLLNKLKVPNEDK